MKYFLIFDHCALACFFFVFVFLAARFGLNLIALCSVLFWFFFCFCFCFVLFHHPACVCCLLLWPLLLPWRCWGNLQVWSRREIYMQSDIMLFDSVCAFFLFFGLARFLELCVSCCGSTNQWIIWVWMFPFNSCANCWLTWIFSGRFLFGANKSKGSTCM